jgi:hypothetical protein
MGGDYYERDVIESTTSTFSNVASQQIRGNDKLHKSLDPTRYVDEALINTHLNPIVFALDDTGSMGDWVYVIYDKLPMFYGQIKIQNYLSDPSVSFSAIGDHNCCTAPLQVSEFGAGVELDQMISKLYLEGNGGGNEHESYELAAYFYLNNVDLGKCEYPFFFVTGDEGYFETLHKTTIKTFLDVSVEKDYNSFNIWADLMKKYNVFHIKKPYIAKSYESKIRNQWETTLSKERVLVFSEPKAVIDVVLGLISVTSGSRTLDEYLKDMEQRGQSKERISLVKELITPYYIQLKSGKINVVKSNVTSLTSNTNTSSNLSNDLGAMYNSVLSELDNDQLKYFKDLTSIFTMLTDQVPEEYKCPLMKTIIVDPVISVTGITYERKAFLYCIKYNLELLSKEEVENPNIVPNKSLEKLIKNFYDQNKCKI